ncbi:MULTISPECIES: SRPBCC domain-containing protein [Microbacterium]|jgi:uncharacterized protein YndB with AHSA1/START domain|uniref:SRPBCC domain-containing protein n=1 Tax=Microbacterium TaxID=33882 RepID=UPI0010F5EDD6|nr:SRPBCC domain-containing protein [Microbacterium sp. 4NA327F11]MCK9917943.1 SRPBCC domain-containing protein [Microbacteriaceae bacterium K1510]
MRRTDRASLLVHVSPAEAFRALIDPDALLTWLPPAGMRGRFERFDLRAGGGYRLVLTYDDPSGAPGKTTADADVSDVRIIEVVPGERIVQAVTFVGDDTGIAGVMTMEWCVRDTPEGAEVTIEARDVPPGIRARDHATGITSSLANLAAHLEP